ncbi:Superoxide dismutase [Mn] [Buchnera aphidicola (Thelaxes suberi)]|uniref:Fe-Mn family superoxide dismutase n=1 Tax=Buchnera aphidicola TaxID=9 RepID=UPI0034647813
MNYLLPQLDYAYNSFEPFIDAETMEIHHTKHHQAYIDNTNNIIKIMELNPIPIESLILSLKDLYSSSNTNINFIKLRNNAGGHINHVLFWKCLKRGTLVHGSLKQAIETNFNSMDNFKKEFENKAISHFGSGWVWLIKKNNKLFIETTFNQDNPLMGESICGISGYPIFGLDLWEHAYYLKYKNRRIDYVQSFWQILNWDEAMLRFEQKS